MSAANCAASSFAVQFAALIAPYAHGLRPLPQAQRKPAPLR